jgi:hypothetical protein
VLEARLADERGGAGQGHALPDPGLQVRLPVAAHEGGGAAEEPALPAVARHAELEAELGAGATQPPSKPEPTSASASA